MKTRTLSMFCEENNVNLEELSEKTGISLELLKTESESEFVPKDIADKIIGEYKLPENYFSEKAVALKTRSLGYFIGINIAWSLIFVLLAIPETIIIFITVTAGESKALSLSLGISAAIINVLSLVSCIYLARYVERNNALTGSFSKYKFLYLILPGAVTSIFAPLGLFMHFSVVSISNSWAQLLSTAVSCVLTALLMKVCFDGDEKEEKTIVKIYCGVGLVSLICSQILSVVYGLISGPEVSDALDALSGGPEVADALVAFSPVQIIQAVVSVLLFALLSFGITKGSEKFPKLYSLWYNVIPIIYSCVPFISIIYNIIEALL